MTDIKLDLEVTGIKELKEAAASFDRLGKVSAKLSAQYKPLGAQTTRLVQETKRLATAQKQLDKAVEEGLITDAQANKAMAEQERLSKERILTDKTLIAQAKKRAKAEKELQKETARLVKEYAPARTAADLYRKKLKEIDQALHRNVISSDEAAKATATLKREFNQFTSGLATGGNQFAKFNVEAYKANQRTKRFASVGLQQAGYQVGDFAVQLQGGTNIAVAFGQQMSQLLGIFGAGGAIAGAGVAIATAFIAPLIDAKKNAKGFNDTLDTIGSTISSMESLGDTLRDILVAPFFEGQQAATSFFARITEEQNKKAAQTVATALGYRKPLTGKGTGILGTLERVKEDLEKGTTQGPLPSYISGEKPVIDQKAIDAVEAAMLDLTFAVRAKTGELLPLEEIAENLVNLAEAGRTSGPIIRKALDDLIQSDDVLLGVYRRVIEKRAEDAKAVAKSVSDKENALMKGTFKLQEDLYEQHKQEQEDDFNNSIAVQAAAQKKLADENAAYVKKQKDLDAAGDLAILNNQAQAEIDLMAANAKYESDQNALRQKELDETNKKIIELAERLSIPFAQALGLIRQAKAEATVGLDAFGGPGDFKYSVPTKFKPGKSKVTKAPKDALVSLMQNLTLQKELLGVEEDRASVLQALGESRNKYTEEQIQRAVDLTEKIRLQTEALEQQKQVGDMVGQSFENAFMSIVDGTKSVQDAFKLMASDIIKELYRIFVVKQITGMISAAVGDVTGLMSGDNPFSGYDGGGYTGSGPRSGGLDGKGGFMAMLHPRETVVDHTKGQGAGGTVVNQVFNISANTSDDTKRLITQTIAQASPAIINQSVGAVMNQRRRGGAMKSAFG
jgi:hypothetical protein